MVTYQLSEEGLVVQVPAKGTRRSLFILPDSRRMFFCEENTQFSCSWPHCS